MAFEGSVILSLSSGVGGVLNVEGSVYILADGRQLPQSQYPVLYAVIAGRYGTVGADFNIPDLRGYYLRGDSLDSARDSNYATRTLYGPSATATGVGTYQPASQLAHTHFHQGSFAPYNAGPPAMPGTTRNYSTAVPNTLTTSGIDLATCTFTTAGSASGIGLLPGVMNPPTYSYFAYIKAS